MNPTTLPNASAATPGTVGRGGQLGTQRDFIARLNATLKRRGLQRPRHSLGLVHAMFEEMKMRRRVRVAA